MSALVEDLPLIQPRWIKLGRVYRRFCYLKHEGRLAEAAALERGELATAETEALNGNGSDVQVQAELAGRKTEWQKQVVTAVATAEIMVPLLAERLVERPVTSAAAPVGPIADRKSRAEAAAGPLDIADFIEDMLAQEGVGAR